MRTPLPWAAGCVAAALALTGCAGTTSPADTLDNPAITDEVTYLTGFGINGRESYVHTAIAKGYFTAEGIRVTVQAGQAGPFNDQAVAAGRAQFAAVDSSGAFVRFANAAPEQRLTRTVAAVHQRTVISLVSLEPTGITTPSDLAGRRLGVAAGAAPRVLWPLYAKLAKIDPAAVTWAESRPDALAGLLVAGKVDAIGLYVTGVPQVQAAEARLAAAQRRAPRTVRVLPYSDHMGDMFGTVLISNAALVRDNPDLVRRFTRALMRGLQYAVEHPQEAGQILHKADPKHNPDTAAAELTAMRPYVTPPAGQPYGAMDPGRVARSVALLQNLPMPAVEPGELVALDLTPRS